jgi:hypothetical protein
MGRPYAEIDFCVFVNQPFPLEIVFHTGLRRDIAVARADSEIVIGRLRITRRAAKIRK